MLQISPQSKNTSDNHKGVTFEQPLELLLSCHEKILHFSSALSELSIVLKKEGWNDALKASSDQIRRYFNVAAHEHHLDEENHLFPAIIALDPEFKQAESIKIIQLINQMIKEHVESDTLWEKLDTMLEEQSEDFNTLDTLIRQFKKEMHEHALIENEHIFPYAKTRLSEDELKKIGLSIAERRGVSQIKLS